MSTLSAASSRWLIRVCTRIRGCLRAGRSRRIRFCAALVFSAAASRTGLITGRARLGGVSGLGPGSVGSFALVTSFRAGALLASRAALRFWLPGFGLLGLLFSLLFPACRGRLFRSLRKCSSGQCQR